jgi:hypothetical protein
LKIGTYVAYDIGSSKSCPNQKVYCPGPENASARAMVQTEERSWKKILVL